MSAAAESGDMESNEEQLAARKNRRPPQVLEKVVIPVNGRSSLASSRSSNLDQLSEYDTPDTSMIMTPAESSIKEEQSWQHPSRIGSNLSCHQSREPFKGKRKRLEVDELMEADALLAKKLQKREYDEHQETTSRSRRARNVLLDTSEKKLLFDSGREHSPDSTVFPKLDISTSKRVSKRRPKAFLSQTVPADVEGGRSQHNSSSEDEISKIPVPRNKRMRTDNRTSLPTRAARDSATKSITDSSFRRILDSEDSDLSEHSDDVSLFGSDIVSDGSGDSEDTDEKDGVVIGAANTSNFSSASSTIPATGRRGTSRRAASSTQATNTVGGRRSWQRRVEDRVSSRIRCIQDSRLRHILGCKRATEARESAP